MNDLISRQKAINTVNAMFKVCDTGSIEDFRDLMLAALADLPPSQQWIPTQCRKPDLNQKVIWQFDYRDGHEYLIGSRNDVMLLADSAVAWMPLPEPYKGGQQWQRPMGIRRLRRGRKLALHGLSCDWK